METKARIAIVGCGNISEIYLQNCVTFGMEIVACTDMDMSRAQAKSEQSGVAAWPLADVFADSSIEIIVNLTPPTAHAEGCAIL